VIKEKGSEAQQILEIGLYRNWFDPLHRVLHITYQKEADKLLPYSGNQKHFTRYNIWLPEASNACRNLKDNSHLPLF